MKTIKKILKVKNNKIQIHLPDEFEDKQVEITARLCSNEKSATRSTAHPIINKIRSSKKVKYNRINTSKSSPFSWVKDPAQYSSELRKKLWNKNNSDE